MNFILKDRRAPDGEVYTGSAEISLRILAETEDTNMKDFQTVSQSTEW